MSFPKTHGATHLCTRPQVTTARTTLSRSAPTTRLAATVRRKISLAGTNFGINPSEVESDFLNLDWQPGGCVLHKKENLILKDFYPYRAKAYSEDLIHSFLLRQSGTSLFVVMKASCMTDLNQRLSIRKEIISDFKAKLYFVRMADLSISRMLIYYMIYVMKSVILNIRSKINKLV